MKHETGVRRQSEKARGGDEDLGQQQDQADSLPRELPQRSGAQKTIV